MKKNEIEIETMAKECNGEIKTRGIEQYISKFCSDTREIQKGEMFISIKPEDGSDGTKYIIEAFEKGAIGCITEYEIAEEILQTYKDKTIIKVKDTIKAIQNLAKYKRELYSIPVVGITGSVGKTTTKEMIASVLEKKYKIAKTRENYNNHIGVPLTILDWEEDIEVAIVEMGMNHLGEISILTNIAKPTIAVITNVGTAHIGLLGSKENILKAKLEILEGLPKEGKVVINNDNDMLNSAEISFEKVTYGIEHESMYNAKNIVINEFQTEYTININEAEYKVLIPASGKHFVWNSMCAIAVGNMLKVEEQKMIEAIKNFKNTGKRIEIKEINNIKMINDYYNANLDSVKAALEVLNKIRAKRKLAILGDMRELGEYEEELHRKVGKEIIKNKIDVLVTVGNLAKYVAQEAENLGLKQIYVFENNESCIQNLKDIIKKDDVVLIKASKSMHFEEIAKAIEENTKFIV